MSPDIPELSHCEKNHQPFVSNRAIYRRLGGGGGSSRPCYCSKALSPSPSPTASDHMIPTKEANIINTNPAACARGSNADDDGYQREVARRPVTRV